MYTHTLPAGHVINPSYDRRGQLLQNEFTIDGG
jgi:hypothetical protein